MFRIHLSYQILIPFIRAVLDTIIANVKIFEAVLYRQFRFIFYKAFFQKQHGSPQGQSKSTHLFMYSYLLITCLINVRKYSLCIQISR